ncbi:MAG: ABC transporter ATP-binding protein [Magnetospirillum sp.]|nr:MAG: ABC transporter ATP-binding protein [Magnetospirillum sp.]
MSDDLVIHAQALRKTYRLYASPRCRLLDVLGLLRHNRGHYTEHTAVNGIDLTIRRGERVAIIGRNGAGKSTLLKLVTKVIEPTSGSIVINGETQALLQIGTGFHPDFTGRQNSYSYLAHLGISGVRAAEAVAEIISFAEIEEYIDQPVKTYSTGMSMRLMFAASTVINPDVLVIDEVLGVGDAYFAHKSFSRIEDMCAGDRTTLLLVSHDIYNAAKLCQRMIWVDRGCVQMDGDSIAVIRAYEESIREQEESRLRSKRHLALTRRDEVEPVLAHLAPRLRASLAEDILVGGLDIFGGDGTLGRWDAGSPDEGQGCRLALDAESNWAASTEVHNGRPAVRLLTHGSIFQKGGFEFSIPTFIDHVRCEAVTAQIRLATKTAQELEIAIFDPTDGRRYAGFVTPDGSGQWQILECSIRADSGVAPTARSVFGGGALRVTDVAFLNGDGMACHVFAVGDPLRIRLTYRIYDPTFDQRPMIIIGFLKDGVVTHRLWTDGLHLSYRMRPTGIIEIEAAPHLASPGNLVVTLSVFQEGAWKNGPPQQIFACNADVIDFHAKAYEIRITPSHDTPILAGTVFQQASTWRLEDQCHTTGLIGEAVIGDKREPA